MPPGRTLNQTNPHPEVPALEMMLQQILDNQRDQGKDISDIKETLRDGSGQFRALSTWKQQHLELHAEEKAKAKEGPHWLVKAAGSAAAGAFGAALMWWILAGVVAAHQP